MKTYKRLTSFALALALLLSMAAIVPVVVLPTVTAAAPAMDAAAGTELINLYTQWRYLDNGTDPAGNGERTVWTLENFDDSAWKTNGSSTAQFGSKRGQITDLGGGITPTVLLNHYLSDGATGVPTYFFRTSFELSGSTAGLLLSGTVVYDDAVIVYINGTKVASYHEPEGGFASNLSYGGSNETAPLTETFTVDAAVLKEGINTIAVEVHNGKSTSSDVYFEMTSLTLSQPDLMDITQEWKYLDDGTDPAGTGDRTSWTTADYDDSAWKSSAGSNAKFGALTNQIADLGNDAIPEVKLQQYIDGTTINTPAFFFRTTFELTGKPEGQMLTGTIKYDDAVIIYINGKKATSLGEPEEGFETNLSYGGTNGIAPASAVFRVDASYLQEGTNVLAVELHQGRASSPDIYFELSSLNFTRTQMKNHSTTVGADETQRNVTWYVNSDVTGTVQYAVKNGDEFPSVYSEAQAVASEASNYVGYYSNKATLTDLQPNTTYVYRLVNGGAVSDVYSFTTGGNGDFSFLFVGDPQIGTSNVTSDAEAWEKTLNTALTAFPGTDFMISAGDQVNTPDNESEYSAYLSAAGLSSLPTATIIGNHDNGSIAYTEHFNNPNTVSTDGKTYGITTAGCNYWYVYNNTLFLHLNSNNQSTAEHKAFMKNAVDANPDVNWRVVVFHHSIYSVAGHAVDSAILDRRTNLVPVFEELDIDVVLMGHDHVYVRSYMMNGLTPDTSAGVQSSVTDPTGILYVTANSASGSKYYDILSNTQFAYAAVKSQEYTTSFSNVEISDSSFKITTYRTADLSVIDTFEILKTVKTVSIEPKAAALKSTAYAAAATSSATVEVTAVKTDAAVTLDGNFSEFSQATVCAFGDAQLRSLWDGKYLYLALEHNGSADSISMEINGHTVSASWSGNTVTGSAGVTGYASGNTVELQIYFPTVGISMHDYGESYAFAAAYGNSQADGQIVFATGDSRTTIPFTASTAVKYIVGFTQSDSTFTLNSASFTGEAYIRTGWHTGYYNMLGTTANYRTQKLAFNHTILINQMPQVQYSNASGKILSDEQGVVFYLHDMRAADATTGVARDEDCILASLYREDDAFGNQNLYLYIHTDVNGGKKEIISLGRTVGTEFALSFVWNLDNSVEVYVDGALVGKTSGMDSGYVGFSSTDIGGCWVKNITGAVNITVTDASLQSISAASLQTEIQSLKDAGTLTTASLIGTTVVYGNLPTAYYGVHIPIIWNVVNGIVDANGQVTRPETSTSVTLKATIAGIELAPATVTVAGKQTAQEKNPGDWLEMAKFNSATFNKSASSNFSISGDTFCFDNETLIDSTTTITNGDVLNGVASSGGIKAALNHSYYDIMLEQTIRIDALPEKAVSDHGVFFGDKIYTRGYSFYMSDRVDGSTNGQDDIMICTIQNEGNGKLALYIANEKRFSAYGSTAIDLGKSLGEEFKLTTVWNSDDSVDVYVDGKYVGSVLYGTRSLYYVGNDSVGFRFSNLDGNAKITISDVRLSADDLAASVSGAWYRSVQEALNHADDNAVVSLRKDVYLDNLSVQSGLLLDLNGHSAMIVSNAVSFGQVIDSAGGGVLKKSDAAQIMIANDGGEYLPVYDKDICGWRILRYSLVSLGVQERNETIRYGFAIHFEDDTAYSLISEDCAGLDFAVNLAWTGNESGQSCVFSDELLREYATLTSTISERGLPGEAALILTVTGADSLPAGSCVWVTPILTSSAGTSVDGDVIYYS